MHLVCIESDPIISSHKKQNCGMAAVTFMCLLSHSATNKVYIISIYYMRETSAEHV